MGGWVIAAAVGFVSGVLSGGFGIGGGIVTTPAIRWLLEVPALAAVGTPLPVIIPGALTGAIRYQREGSADLRAAAVMGIAGALTSVGGALLATRVGGTAVLAGTGVLILWAAADTIHQVARPSAAVDHREGPRATLVVLAGMGALTGLYSGFFGLGGGFVLVPMLTRWLHMNVKRAIGTSLATVALLAVPGTAAHACLGNVDWVIALGLAIGVVPGALVGAHLTLGAHERHVRLGFAALLAAVGIVLAVTELWGATR